MPIFEVRGALDLVPSKWTILLKGTQVKHISKYDIYSPYLSRCTVKYDRHIYLLITTASTKKTSGLLLGEARAKTWLGLKIKHSGLGIGKYKPFLHNTKLQRFCACNRKITDKSLAEPETSHCLSWQKLWLKYTRKGDFGILNISSKIVEIDTSLRCVQAWNTTYSTGNVIWSSRLWHPLHILKGISTLIKIMRRNNIGTISLENQVIYFQYVFRPMSHMSHYLFHHKHQRQTYHETKHQQPHTLLILT